VFREGVRLSLPPAQASKCDANSTVEELLRCFEDSAHREGDATALFVFIFDQFEEVFALDESSPEEGERIEKMRWSFFDDQGEARAVSTRFAIFAMREEYLAQLERVAPLMPTDFGVRYRLGLLQATRAQDAIVLPARQVNVDYASSASELLLKEL